MDTIECMRTFAAVASDASFTRASKRLNMTTKRASKYVRQLEERLGAQLFSRTTRSVMLTDIGRAYLQRCQQLLEEFDELEATVQERHRALAGTIRITAPTSFGSTRLIFALAPFLKAHPGVTVDLQLTDRRVSVIDEGFDLAVRLGALTDSALISKKLSSMRLVVCASPDYLAQHGRPERPKELSNHQCLINTGLIEPHLWRFIEDEKEIEIRVDGQHRMNSPRATAEMAAAGMGVGLCPMYVVEAHIKSGALEVLVAPYERMETGVFALYPPNRHLSARVRALIDHLANWFTGLAQ